MRLGAALLVLLLAVTGVVATTAPAEAEGASVDTTVSGTVWDDRNADGDQDAGEPGLEGVAVRAAGGPGGNGGGAASTDAGGHYAIFVGYEGNYDVIVSTPAGMYATTPNPTNTDVDGDGTSGIDFGFRNPDVVNLPLSGTVFDDRDGDGVQDAGEPGIDGVSVRAFGGPGGNGGDATLSDADGHYTIPVHAVGNYDVTVVTPAGMVATTPNPQNTDVDEDGTSGIDFGFRTPAPPGQDLTIAADGEGDTVTFSGEGNPGQQVTVEGTREDEAPVEVGTTTVDEHGDWTLTTQVDDGAWDFTAVEEDGDGHETDRAELGDPWLVDITGPTVEIGGIDGDATELDACTATVSVEDRTPDGRTGDQVSGVDTTTITLDGQPYESGDPIGAGTHQLLIVSRDVAGNESTRTVAVQCQHPTEIRYDGDETILTGGPAVLAAVLTYGGNPVAVEPVTLTLGTGTSAQTCTGTTGADGRATCTITQVTQPAGNPPVRVSFAGDERYEPSSATDRVLVYTFGGGGRFVVGDRTVGNPATAVGRNVNFWGAQWERNNVLSGGAAPSAFKGFQDSTTPVVCGQNWSSRPGNSGHPPSEVPEYLGLIVSSRITKSGSTTTGDTLHVVIVRTGAGYSGNPGHAGFGQIVGVVC